MYILVLLMVFMMMTVCADCPYSGYVPGSPGIVISKWVPINDTMCWGVCPDKAMVDPWKPLNKTARWVYENGVWVERFWRCETIIRQNTPVQDCREYERIPFQAYGEGDEMLTTQNTDSSLLSHFINVFIEINTWILN